MPLTSPSVVVAQLISIYIQVKSSTWQVTHTRKIQIAYIQCIKDIQF